MENINTGKKKFKGKVILVSLLVIVLAILSFVIFSPKNLESIKDSVVMIKVYDKQNNQISTGSGFCAYESNYIVTNFHVIKGAYKIKIIADDKKEYPINDILIFNQEHDLAILSGDFKFKPISIGNDAHLKVGDNVIAIGSPKGELNTVSTGIISNADNDFEIRITAPISPGSSGGVLLNKFNKVIGITYATHDAQDSQNLNYAISAGHLKKMFSAFENDEYTTLNGHSYINPKDLTSKEKANLIKEGYITNLRNFGDEYYSVTSLNVWNALTSEEGKLKHVLSDDWYDVYNIFSNELKQDVYKQIDELETISFNSKEISKNIKKWSVLDFFVNLDILDIYQYSIVTTDISLCDEKYKIFDAMKEYPLKTAEKTLIFYLIGKCDWSEIHSDNKEDIYNYFGTRYETEDLDAILEWLKFPEYYEDDGALTTVW